MSGPLPPSLSLSLLLSTQVAKSLLFLLHQTSGTWKEVKQLKSHCSFFPS